MQIGAGDATTTKPENGASANDAVAESGITEADISLMKKILRNKLVQSKNNVEITRNDPNSPLYSIKSFEELRL